MLPAICAPHPLGIRLPAPATRRRSRPLGRENAHRGLSRTRRSASAKSRPQVPVVSGENAGGPMISYRTPLLPQGNQNQTNWKQIGQCFVKGAVVGAVSAVAVGALVVGAIALGAPAAVVSGVLGVAALAGGGVAVYQTATDIWNGNWAGTAYTVGNIAGGLAVGFAGGLFTARAINPAASSGWSASRDIANRYQPNFPGGSTSSWLASGPDKGAAVGALAASGGGGTPLAGLLGCPYRPFHKFCHNLRIA